jgi:uncharacterized OB-fold protein
VTEIIEQGTGDVPDLDGRPLPELDHVSATYWGAAARGELLFQECPACGHRQFYPRAMCTACAADTAWRRASGRGTVHTFTIIRQNLAPPWRQWLPYVVAMVELEEGPRMMSNITHCEVDDVCVGLPVACYMVRVDDGLAVPFWRPAES